MYGGRVVKNIDHGDFIAGNGVYINGKKVQSGGASSGYMMGDSSFMIGSGSVFYGSVGKGATFVDGVHMSGINVGSVGKGAIIIVDGDATFVDGVLMSGKIVGSEYCLVNGVEITSKFTLKTIIGKSIRKLVQKTGSVFVTGNANTIKSTSGDVSVYGNVDNIDGISGDITVHKFVCGNINTVSGNISKSEYDLSIGASLPTSPDRDIGSVDELIIDETDNDVVISTMKLEHISDININGQKFSGSIIQVFANIFGGYVKIDDRKIASGMNIVVSINDPIVIIEQEIGNICVNDNVYSIETISANVFVTKDVKVINTTSGNIKIGDVKYNITTISGSVKCMGVKGICKTISGDILGF